VPLSLTIKTDIQTQRFLSTVYGKNSGRLPGIIAFKNPIDDNIWRKIKGDVMEASTSGNYMFLRGVGDGVTWLQAAASIKEMETLQGRRLTKEDIFDIAPGLYNMTFPNGTEANAKVGQETFNNFTLYPLLTGMSGRVNKNISPYYGDITVEFDDPRNIEQQAEAAKMAIETQRVAVFSGYAAYLPVPVAARLAEIELPPGDYSAPAPALMPAETPAPQIMSAEENALADELLTWAEFEKRHQGRGRKFETKHIPPALEVRIRSGLKSCNSVADIQNVFDGAGVEIPLIVLANSIDRMVQDAN
jgi:hypothetical protein